MSPYLPVFSENMGRDSGVFIYTGKQVLDGKIPYLDVWDHKGPLLYYINAFGLLLGNYTLYGLWIIQFTFIALSAFVSFYLLKISFGKIPAITGTFFWLTNLPLLIEGGNLTEEYALLFQFIAIFFFYLSEKQRSIKYMFWVGIFSGLCATLKPNIVGIFIAAAIYLTLKGLVTKEYYHSLKSAISMFIGATLPLLAFSLYFILKGAMHDFLDQYLYYNLIYSGTPILQKLGSIRSGFNLIIGSDLVIVAWALALIIIGVTYYRKSLSTLIKEYPLIIFSAILFPLDLILASGSGRAYAHYYMTWLPVFGLLFAILIWFILWYLRPELKIKLSKYLNKLLNEPILSALLLILLLLPIFTLSCIYTPYVYHQDPSDLELVSFIEGNSLASDKVLFWGAETKFNVMSNRDAPSKYVYQYPFFMQGYAKQSMVNEFVFDLKSNPPKYIIDTSATSMFPPIGQIDRAKEKTSRLESVPNINLDDYFSFVNAHYRPVKIVPDKNWVIYQLNEAV